MENRDFSLTNCILWDNVAYENPQAAISRYASIDYCCIEGGLADITDDPEDVDWGPGNIDTDPCFADAFCGDYHLKSEMGRWDANEGKWKTDEATSPCIDAGDPNTDWTAELWPHGKCINMGAFGGTNQGSMSASSLGNIADVDGSDKVDYVDMRFLADKWLMQKTLSSEDLDRDGSVNSKDFAVFAGQWLWEQ